MKRDLPPLNALRAFEAAAQRQSFSEAAALLHVTHGAVSRQIRLLEDWLGAPLFERHHRQVRLTDAGRAYLADIGAALEQIETASARLRQGPVPLRVSAPATFTLRWLIPRLSRFQLQYPHIEVKLSTSSEPISQLGDSFDIAIRGGPQALPGFVAREFLRESRLPVCSPGLLEQLPIHAPADLARHTLLHTAGSPEFWPQWLAAAGEPALRPAAELTLEHFYLTLQAALGGLGVALGPSRLIADDLASGRLVQPFAAPRLEDWRYFAYARQAREDQPAVLAFCRWLAQAGQD
ncbi:transcriptional regulator GcvA [Chromobacterium sp. IIBBL 290-4]|uniref:transcriptional regulator GcvA n=1 Tax=Chromobacterium sp. IIBBL 290-4 TaxID=2953890 RepID=UPI0020B7B66C|nr:transcriptional regulator GcvA [Chromobacterium sp. IIBBL 290-4]UTH76411.1 transcriptional regulator GcvA [Chromobacterium sp. IIBBL 290-4]